MSRMIRSKKEYKCSKCNKVFLKWQGICSSCGEGGSIQEVVLVPPPPKATLSQKALNARSKRSERSIARRMQDIDGRDPEFSRLSTSTGRVGHLTHLRFDAISTTYTTENKNRILPLWLIKAWILISQRAVDFNKHALLHLDPPNLPKTVPLNGQQLKLDTMAVIGQTRHEYLIVRSRKLEMIENIVLGADATTDKTASIILEILKDG
jgi:hypothetical protein